MMKFALLLVAVREYCARKCGHVFRDLGKSFCFSGLSVPLHSTSTRKEEALLAMYIIANV